MDDQDIQFEALFREARNGRAVDRAELVEMFRDYLRATATAALRNRHVEKLSTSDLVQSAIIAANQDFDSCRATTRLEFRAWLRQIMVNDLMNRFRDLYRDKRDVRREKPTGERLEIEDELTGPLGQAIKREDKERLMSALAELAPERREIIQLRYRDGLSFAEIAVKLGKTPDATRMVWNRAIESLSKIIARQRDQP